MNALAGLVPRNLTTYVNVWILNFGIFLHYLVILWFQQVLPESLLISARSLCLFRSSQRLLAELALDRSWPSVLDTSCAVEQLLLGTLSLGSGRQRLEIKINYVKWVAVIGGFMPATLNLEPGKLWLRLTIPWVRWSSPYHAGFIKDRYLLFP